MSMRSSSSCGTRISMSSSIAGLREGCAGWETEVSLQAQAAVPAGCHGSCRTFSTRGLLRAIRLLAERCTGEPRPPPLRTFSPRDAPSLAVLARVEPKAVDVQHVDASVADVEQPRFL